MDQDEDEDEDEAEDDDDALRSLPSSSSSFSSFSSLSSSSSYASFQATYQVQEAGTIHRNSISLCAVKITSRRAMSNPHFKRHSHSHAHAPCVEGPKARFTPSRWFLVAWRNK